MSAPTMKEFKADYVTVGEITYYDITNLYQENPLEVIKSKVIYRMGTSKGEWYNDPDFGFPTLAININSTDPDVIAQLMADEILKIENVTNVNVISKDYNTNTRVFTSLFNVFTIYGDFEIGTEN